jgi:hypothetical protein
MAAHDDGTRDALTTGLERLLTPDGETADANASDS